MKSNHKMKLLLLSHEKPQWAHIWAQKEENYKFTPRLPPTQHRSIVTVDFPEAGSFLSFDADGPEVCLAVRQPPPHLHQSTVYIVAFQFVDQTIETNTNIARSIRILHRVHVS